MIPFLNLSQVSYFPETLQYEIIKEKFIQIANPIPNRSNCSAIKYPATAHIFVTFSTQLPNVYATNQIFRHFITFKYLHDYFSSNTIDWTLRFKVHSVVPYVDLHTNLDRYLLLEAYCYYSNWKWLVYWSYRYTGNDATPHGLCMLLLLHWEKWNPASNSVFVVPIQGLL